MTDAGTAVKASGQSPNGWSRWAMRVAWVMTSSMSWSPKA